MDENYLDFLFETQPAPWPQWQRGYVEAAGIGPDGQLFGRAPTHMLHLFLAEPLRPVAGRALYRIVAACQFCDGAKFVAFDPDQALDHDDWSTLCPDCWQISPPLA